MHSQRVASFQNMFCNETSIPRDCSREFCECVHRLKVGLNDVVELVLIADGKHGMGNHPMHLHGHNFYVMGMEKVKKNGDCSSKSNWCERIYLQYF